MTEAYIFDHVRSPRGRGKPNGSLHAITPIKLAGQVLGAIRDRNELDTSLVDDVVLGCVVVVNFGGHFRIESGLSHQEQPLCVDRQFDVDAQITEHVDDDLGRE